MNSTSQVKQVYAMKIVDMKLIAIPAMKDAGKVKASGWWILLLMMKNGVNIHTHFMK